MQNANGCGLLHLRWSFHHLFRDSKSAYKTCDDENKFLNAAQRVGNFINAQLQSVQNDVGMMRKAA
jgi:hypothetical protein